MKFIVVDSWNEIDKGNRDTVYLWNTRWDDFFKFETTYRVAYIDQSGIVLHLGDTKIGMEGLKGAGASSAGPKQRVPDLPNEFEQLPRTFFSIGQEDEYYDILAGMGASFRETFLVALRDIAFDEELRNSVLNEDVTKTSLMRFVSLSAIEKQFSRIARGGSKLTSYSFSFRPLGKNSEPVLKFAVEPHSMPPTNLHVIIGRNGVGKSRSLSRLTESIVQASRDHQGEPSEWLQIANVVSVSFSAFDDITPIQRLSPSMDTEIPVHYVGLKKKRVRKGESSTKDPAALKREMTRSLKECMVGFRLTRLIRALKILSSDRVLADHEFVRMLEELHYSVIDGEGRTELINDISRRFSDSYGDLSSGHKIILLSISKLIETVEEKTLVLLDEPEAHLHPPLLSAYVRVLSELLTDSNAMAIIATHSPVVLQEVPRRCTWRIERYGEILVADRPRIETFGENVGILTHEIFGLEVKSTGFYTLLQDAAQKSADYDGALSQFSGQLGSEARAMLRAIMARR